MEHRSHCSCNDRARNVGEDRNKQNEGNCTAEAAYDFPSNFGTDHLHEHLQGICKLQSTLWLWKVWRMIRLLPRLSNRSLVRLISWHHIDLYHHFTIVFNFTIYSLASNLEPKSTLVFIIKLQWLEALLILKDFIVVFLIEAHWFFHVLAVFE